MLTNVRVEEIMVGKEGAKWKAVGVRLQNGDEIRANTVISDAGSLPFLVISFLFCSYYLFFIFLSFIFRGHKHLFEVVARGLEKRRGL